MGGQRRGLQEVQLKRAKRAQKRASRKRGASSVADNTVVRKFLDAEESQDARCKNEMGLDVSETTTTSQKQEIEKKGVSPEIKYKHGVGGSSESVEGKAKEDQSIQKIDVGMEKAETLYNAESTMAARMEEMNGPPKLRATRKSSEVEDSSKCSKLETTSKSSKLEISSNSSIVGSSLPVDTTWTCYAPTCTVNKPKEESEARSNLCYSPSCRFSSNDPTTSADTMTSIEARNPVKDRTRDAEKDSEAVPQDEKSIFEDRDGLIEKAGDVELDADLEALTTLSLELEETSDQQIPEKGDAVESGKLATQKKSLGGRRLTQEDGSPKSMLQELQDVISEDSIQEGTIPEETVLEGTIPEGTVLEGTNPEGTISEGTIPKGTIPERTIPEGTIPEGPIPEETIPEGSHNVDSDHPQNHKERSEKCAWEVKQFKKSFEAIQLDIQILEARIEKLEEKKVSRAEKLKEEQEEMEQTILPQPIVVKPFAVDDDSDFEEFTRDKQEENQKTRQERSKEGKEKEKPWEEDWEDDFEVEELASVLLAVK